ncbi:hypothetical protein V1264_001739 [Littorina saxatilis]|uniref:C-type lectin domain-containing protein n=1 Tax=Littorina saxatilis TaxID=31220 RepID=A0AAN9C1V2_9CAEN
MALTDLLFHMLMPRIYDIIIMMSLLSSVCSVVTIPSKASHQAKKLVYYDNGGTWYDADRVCRATGGYLVLIDGPEIVEKLKKLQENNNFYKFWTGMVRQDDGEFYSQDDACSPISKTSWSWKNRDDATRSYEQCVFVDDGKDFSWSTEKCDNGRNFMCEHDTNGTCSFQMTSVSLASLPVSNASMALCQATCRQMIGCFATAPSGHATLPPFTHCLFVVTGDDSNPMAANDCPYEYEEDTETKAEGFPRPPSGDPDGDPVDCVPGNTTRSSVTGQRSLSEFVQEFNNRTHILITPSPVVETAQVTLTPDVQMAYVTLSPNIVTDYVTLTPDTEFAYVTLTPDVVTAYVTLTPSTMNEVVTSTVQEMVTTTVEQVMTSTVRKMTTTTLTTLVGQSCSQSKVTTTASKAIMLSPALTQTVTRTQTHVVNETESHVMNVTETHKVTQTQTQVVTQTQTTTATATVAMNPTTCVQPSSSVLPDISPSFSSSSGNNTGNNDNNGNNNNGNNGNNGQNTIDDSGSNEISGNDNNIIIIDNCGNSSSPNMTKTEKEVEEELEALVKELKVNPVNVSRSRRKKESAPDERKSAQSLGAVAVVVMVVGVVLLVLVDGSTLFCYIHRLVRVRHDENS